MSDQAKALPALTGLRFFAAGAVVLYHAEPLTETWPEALKRAAHSGYAAVALFYVLSGFVLAWNYAEPIARGAARASDFWVARLARVFPLYLLGVAWSFTLLFSTGTPLEVLALPTVASALGLQSWYPPFIWLGNVPGWSISNELFFYAVFPLLAARLVGTASQRRAWVILVGSYAASFVPYLLMVAAGKDSSEFVRFAPICRLPEFVLGMALGRLFVLERASAKERSGVALSVGGVLAILVVTWFERSLPYHLFHDGLLAPLFAMLVYGLARGGANPLVRALATRPLVVLGELSFAIYLLHEPLKQTLARFVRYDGSRAEIWTGHLVHQLALLACAALSWRLLERPARAWMRQLGARRLLWCGYAGLLSLLAVYGWSIRPGTGHVVLVSNFQALVGCGANWAPACRATELRAVNPAAPWPERVYSARLHVPAGEWEYKVALDDAWRESFGAPGGGNLRLSLSSAREVQFLFSRGSHALASNAAAPLLTLVGSHQPQLGCRQAFDPDCDASWLQDFDGDGAFTWTTQSLRAGEYEAKIAIDHQWVNDGVNLHFSVPADHAPVELTWNPVTRQLSLRQAR